MLIAGRMGLRNVRQTLVVVCHTLECFDCWCVLVSVRVCT